MTRNLNQTGLLPQADIDRFAIGIIGTGAIGSFVAMALSKMGFTDICTWDPDKIEEHNIANQMFPVDSVGMKKAIATRAMVKQFSGTDISTLSLKASGNSISRQLDALYRGKMQIVILAVDSLDTRKAIAECLYMRPDMAIVDARMGALTYRVMGLQTNLAADWGPYRNTFVADSLAVQEPCGQKSIIYTVLGVAAEICSFVHRIVMSPSYNFDIPNPVVFDYKTGMRIQKITSSEIVDFTVNETVPY